VPAFPSSPRSGSLIVDTCCLKRLDNKSVRSRLIRQLKMIDFTPWPSAINAIEVAALSEARYRERYQEALRFLADGRSLLPWPHDVLKDVALSIVQRKKVVVLRNSGLDYLINEPVGAKHLALARQVTSSSKASWSELYQAIRTDIKSFMAQRNMKSPWDNAPAFLDEVVLERRTLSDFMSSLWAGFGLPGLAPVAQLMRIGPWRALLEAHGILAFERAFTGGAEPKQAHVWDLLQLVYMAGPARKILVTEDRPFLRAARAVLHGRYPNALVLHWDEFLE
jgi:hypothetical protein